MALRIALRTDKDFAGVKAFVDSRQMGGFAVREVSGDNEHWHWLLTTDKFKNLQSFRVNLTRAVAELKGNGAYSATAVEDLEKYQRYMCKGNSDGESPEIVWRNSIEYTDDWVSARHADYWKENARLKKRKVGSIMDSVIDDCKRDGVDWKDRSRIAERYVREVSKRSKPLNTFAAKSAVNGIQLALCPDDSAIAMFAETL